MAERDGAVTGVLPLTLVKTRLFGTRLIANAFCVRGGPIAADAASLEALDAAAVKLMEELARAGAGVPLPHRIIGPAGSPKAISTPPSASRSTRRSTGT